MWPYKGPLSLKKNSSLWASQLHKLLGGHSHSHQCITLKIFHTQHVKSLSRICGSRLADRSVFQTSCVYTLEAIHYATLCVGWLMMSPLQGCKENCHDNQCALLLDFPPLTVWRPHKETHPLFKCSDCGHMQVSQAELKQEVVKDFLRDRGDSETALTHHDAVSESWKLRDGLSELINLEISLKSRYSSLMI